MDPHTAPDLLRYPIGRFELKPGSSSRLASVADIVELPSRFSHGFAGLHDAQLDTPYRPGGWSLRQLAHHLADSHMNAYVRLRLALTEDWPTIKPYQEARWAELQDARTAPIATSLELLTPLHARAASLLESLDEPAWQRGYVHPESGRTSVDTFAQLYSWHGRHHTAHVTALRERMGW